MATNKRHKNNTMLFEDLAYEDQARSINAQLRNIEAAVKAHSRKAESENRPCPLIQFRKQVIRLLLRIEEI